MAKQQPVIKVRWQTDDGLRKRQSCPTEPAAQWVMERLRAKPEVIIAVAYYTHNRSIIARYERPSE